MTNCFEKQYGKGTTVDDLLMKIKIPLDDGIVQPVSTERSLPEKKAEGSVHPGKAGYEAKCSACHANQAIGAPVLGDKDAWAEVMNKGLDAVYKNALNGINAMPPKGGHMDTPDDEIKQIVDYMIEASK
jgi:cytochrome c